MSEETSSDADYQALLEPSDQDANAQLNHSLHLRVVVGGEPGVEAEQKLAMTTTAEEGEKNDFNDGKYKTSTLFRVTAYIIVMEFCERLAYYGFAGLLGDRCCGACPQFRKLKNCTQSLDDGVRQDCLFFTRSIVYCTTVCTTFHIFT